VKYGLPANRRTHDFRHTHATWGLQEGIRPKVMSEQLGHFDIAITLGLYSHVTEAMQQPVVDFLESGSRSRRSRVGTRRRPQGPPLGSFLYARHVTLPGGERPL
jgi:Phage integrase family